MLSKQAWRVLANPDSLIVCIYKARYFPDCSFWDAEEQHFFLFMAQHIWYKEVIWENSYWQVGDGNDISIFSDNWLPGLELGRPTYSVSNSQEFTRVSDLIEPSGIWNEAKIESFLCS